MNLIIITLGMLSPKGISGSDNLLIEVGKRLVAKGAKLTIVTSKAGEIAFSQAGLDANFWIIDDRDDITWAGLLRTTIILLKRSLKAGILLRKKTFPEKSIIYASSDAFWEAFPLVFVKDKKVKRVSSFHMISPKPFKGYRGAFTNKWQIPSLREIFTYLQQRLSLICIKHASDFIFAQSNMCRFLVDKGIPSEKMVKFDQGIDWGTVNNVTPQGERYDACWIGRYHIQKGCDDLIEIWRLVCQEKGEAKLAIMGNVAKEFEPLIKRGNLEENIDLLGYADTPTKFRVMKESKLFLFPSYYESWGVVIAEAMACGLPVIAYDLPVYQDIYPKGMAKLPIGDKKAFAAQVLRLLGDEEERKKLSERAKETASEYDWDKVAQDFYSGIKEKLMVKEKA